MYCIHTFRLRLHYSGSVWTTAEKSNKTAFRLHSTGADLFENVTFAVATRPRFLNVVERKRSATALCKHKRR